MSSVPVQTAVWEVRAVGPTDMGVQLLLPRS